MAYAWIQKFKIILKKWGREERTQDEAKTQEERREEGDEEEGKRKGKRDGDWE